MSQIDEGNKEAQIPNYKINQPQGCNYSIGICSIIL